MKEWESEKGKEETLKRAREMRMSKTDREREKSEATYMKLTAYTHSIEHLAMIVADVAADVVGVVFFFFCCCSYYGYFYRIKLT